LEIVTDPDVELRLAEPAAAAVVGEHGVLPLLVEQRPPREVEVDRESEDEALEADAIRRASVSQAEAADVHVFVYGRAAAGGGLLRAVDVDQRLVGLSLTGHELVAGLRVLLLEVRGADVGEEDAADAAEHADRRQHRLHQREPELGVGEEALVADEGQIVVAAQLGVAAEVEEVGIASPAVEAAQAERRDTVASDALIPAHVSIHRLAIQR